MQELRAGLTATIPVTITSTPPSPVAGVITVNPVIVQTVIDGNPASQAGVTQFDPNDANPNCSLAEPCEAAIVLGPGVGFDVPVPSGSRDAAVIATIEPDLGP